MAEPLEQQMEKAKAQLSELIVKKDRLPGERALAGASGDAVRFVKLGGELDASNDMIEAMTLKVAGLELQIEEAKLATYESRITAAYGPRMEAEARLKEAQRAFQDADNEWARLIHERGQQEQQVRSLRRKRDGMIENVSHPRGAIMRSRWRQA